MATVSKALKEITAFELDQFSLFLDYMPNPELLFEQTGETLEVYNRMLLDEEIGASLEVRKRALLSYPHTIAPADNSAKAAQVADFVRDALERVNAQRLIEQLLTALDYGYSVNELVWADPKTADGHWVLNDAVLLKPERFGFTPKGELVTATSHQRIDAKFKFVVHRHGIAPENPYGVSVLRRCYWPWTFKRAGWRFWLIAAEKFGVPSILALFQAQDEKQAQERAEILANMLSSLQTDAAAALANVDDVKVIESQGLKGFSTLIEMCNRAISKAITGQTLATGEGQYGTRAQATVHEQILYEVVDSDAKEVAATLNATVIPWLVELNFGQDAPAPRFEWDLAEETPWERIKDAIDRGVPLSRTSLYSKYGLPKPTDYEDIFLAPGQQAQQALPPQGTPPTAFADDDGKRGGPDFFSQTPRRRTFRRIW